MRPPKVTKKYFDPTDKDHLKIFAGFLKTNAWVSGCPFYLEEPYHDIPDMCKDKISRHVLKL